MSRDRFFSHGKAKGSPMNEKKLFMMKKMLAQAERMQALPTVTSLESLPQLSHGLSPAAKKGQRQAVYLFLLLVCSTSAIFLNLLRSNDVFGGEHHRALAIFDKEKDPFDPALIFDEEKDPFDPALSIPVSLDNVIMMEDTSSEEANNIQIDFDSVLKGNETQALTGAPEKRLRSSKENVRQDETN